MKFQLKHIVAAAALAVTSSAFAINTGPADGNGGMFLNVWQKNGANGGTFDGSYAIDLGVKWSDFVANQNVDNYINKVINDTYFSQFLAAAGSNVGNSLFSVFGGDQQVDTPLNNLIMTYTTSTAKPSNGSELGTALDSVANYTGALNATGSFIDPTVGSGGASFNTSGAVLYPFGAGLNTLSGASSPNSGLIGTSLGVVQFTQASGDPIDAPIKTIYPGTFKFAQQGSNYVLQYQVAAAVPEPTGLALALAGFGAVGFVARRRKQA
jgi:hypothetical protein